MDTNAFWSHVATGDGCWEWTAARNGHGYGVVVWEGRQHKAHRVAYALEVGPIPAGRSVLHSCDNRACVRPDHLRVGTQAENMADMDGRGRRFTPFRGQVQSGERNRNARITEDDVREIRRRFAAGEAQRDIADDFGISQPNVSCIVRRVSWGGVA